MINALLPSRIVVFLVAAVALAGTIAIQSAPAPLLTIERSGGNVRLNWTNDEPGFVLQAVKPLHYSGSWQTVTQTPQLLGRTLGVTLPMQTNGAQFFRLKSRGVAFNNPQEVLSWSSGGTVDTSTFLSADSQDPLKLKWTISSNAVGATIGPGGVVTLGTGMGSFTVTASATNGAWQDSFTLHAFRLAFTTPSSTLTWQANGIFNAQALLALDGLTDPALLDWSISGSPAATIDAAGVVTLGSGGGSYTIQATAKGTPDYSDVMTLNAVEVSLVSIGFVDAGAGNGGDNQHVLYENAGPQDWGDGGAITNPVWIAGAPGADAPPVRNAPVCYTSSGAVGSKARVQVVVNIKPAGQTLDFIGLDESTEYFRINGILSAGGEQTIDMVASVPLPATIEKFTKTFTWQAVFPDGGPGLVCNAGQTTQTLYTVYAAPITFVEGQTNNPTPHRLDFCIVWVANGLSNKVDICQQIVARVRSMTGSTFGAMPQNPRWTFYDQPEPRELDCHHRAALAASAFGVIGIQGYVHRIYATCHPVPATPQYFPANSTPNDYAGTYTTHRLKYRRPGADVHKLLFVGNNFEGCIRVEDGSADDGNMWWTIWPVERYENAKALIIGYSAQVPELWEQLDGTFVADETVPVDQLADKPKFLGGPD